jgi:3-methyladenine DNA glycosylase AlkD
MMEEKRSSSHVRAISPDRLAREATRLLKREGDADRARQFTVYFKAHEKVWGYGVRTPVLRQIERELFDRVRGHWKVEDASRFCRLMLENRYQEPKGVGLLLLGRYKRDFAPSLLLDAERWLDLGLCGNWALVDTLCPMIVTPLIARYPELVPVVKSWSGSENLWRRRASAVAFIPLVRRGNALDDAYEVAVRLLGDREDLIHKATGWMLREAGKTDAKRLEKFLLEQGPRVPRTALRYAIERFPEAKRKRILVQTR